MMLLLFLQDEDDGLSCTRNRLDCAGVAQKNSRKRAVCEYKIMRHFALVETLLDMTRNGYETLRSRLQCLNRRNFQRLFQVESFSV